MCTCKLTSAKVLPTLQCCVHTPQVLWLGHPKCNATWEPGPSLPQDLVKQFEESVGSEVRVDKQQLYGHMCSTVTVVPISPDTQKAKKVRRERPCHVDSEG